MKSSKKYQGLTLFIFHLLQTFHPELRPMEIGKKNILFCFVYLFCADFECNVLFNFTYFYR